MTLNKIESYEAEQLLRLLEVEEKDEIVILTSLKENGFWKLLKNYENLPLSKAAMEKMNALYSILTYGEGDEYAGQ